MVIEGQLSRDQFMRLFLLRHFQRLSFYFYALTSGALTAYGLFVGPLILVTLGWLPLGIYMMIGLVSGFLGSRGKDKPYLLPTRYEFSDQGVTMRSSAGSSNLSWEHFDGWRVMVGCYVLLLSVGAIVAFPQTAVAPHQMNEFEALLSRHIKRR